MSIPRRTFRSPAEPVTSVDMPDAVETGGAGNPAVASSIAPDVPSDGAVEAASAGNPAPAPDALVEAAGESIEPVPVESAPAAQTPLERAQAALASNDADIARLADRRNALLLEDALDEAAIARLDAELARHQHRQKTLTDRLALLGAEAEREAAELRDRRRAARITEVEAILARRDAAADELQRHLVAAEEAFRKVHALGLEVRNGWSWPHGRAGVLLATSSDLVMQTQSYLFKIGGRPIQTGGQYQPDVPPSFPGARCPRIEWLQSPEVLPDLVDEYRAASRYASNVMRDIAPVLMPASPDRTGDNPPVASDVAVAAKTGEAAGVQSPNVPPLSASMIEILRRQAVLASRDMSEADEVEYAENGRRLQEMSA